MPLGLYTPFVDGLGHLSLSVALPGLLGAAVTMLLLPKFINRLFEKHYSVAFHTIVGVVIAATVMTVPWEGFTGSLRESMLNLFSLLRACFLPNSWMLLTVRSKCRNTNQKKQANDVHSPAFSFVFFSAYTRL